MWKKPKLLEHLEATASMFPIPAYWLDIDGNILGGNEVLLKEMGTLTANDFIGKKASVLYPKEMADHMVQHNIQATNTGIVVSLEETIKDLSTGEMKSFTATKTPLRDNKGNIIGLMTTLIKFPPQHPKEEPLIKKAKLLEDMGKIASLIPTPIYWENANSTILGANESVINEFGGNSFSDFVGKSLYELYPKEIADHIKWHNEEVMRTGQILSQEEKIVDKKGQIKYYAAIKAPLRDDDGNIVGLVGASVNITKQKELENLKFQEQEKFTKLANQVAHDIRSPVASLLMIVKDCTQIPEDNRIALREAAIGIGDIANHLLHQYQKKETAEMSEYEERQPILVSTVLLETLSAKKYQYAKLPVKFDYHFKPYTHFAFVKTQASAFKRMLSNLINNAVEALDGLAGKVTLQLEANNEWVQIIIQDTGKGMSAELIDKIMHKTAVTQGKESGHGIGLTQVWETLDHNQGELNVVSELGLGTTITLTFPRVTAPHWIAEEIVLKGNDTIIILDDDNSIHGAWRARFEGILNEHKLIQLKHFQQGREALEFIQALALTEKESVFLLSDYELLTQELNGLHIISQSKIKRSMLVTSHYADPLIQTQAAKINIKILPKQLASEILINIVASDEPGAKNVALEKIDAVIVDDDRTFVNMLVLYVFDDKITEEYCDPEHFLGNADKYPKDTKIFLDNHYATSDLKGLDVAKELHARGYQRLYLLSGEAFNLSDIPSYLTVIEKTDVDRLKKMVNDLL